MTVTTLPAPTQDAAPRHHPHPTFEVLRPGLQTTVQDHPGRVGHWSVGIPPSGPMDDLSFGLANLAVGNPAEAAGLECTLLGPELRATADVVVCVTGAPAEVTVDGRAVPQWAPVHVGAGSRIAIGAPTGAGMRTYLAVAGGIDVPEYLGSRSTFVLGGFGGVNGRALRAGDSLPVGGFPPARRGPMRRILHEEQPEIGTRWTLEVTEGPHGAPEFFTTADIADLHAVEYTVTPSSDRTGLRLTGPRPRWARASGGEAGLHPSNIHDNPYAIGALDFTGDTPVLLGPDGPSLGGFVCPVTVVTAERWKLGQLAPGDTVTFVPIPVSAAAPRTSLGRARRASSPTPRRAHGDGDQGVLRRGGTGDGATAVTYRRCGDDNILIEYGRPVLDLESRARVHFLHTALLALNDPGIIDLTPGVRSLQVHVDPDLLPLGHALALAEELESTAPGVADLVVPSRTVRLPLSWDDPTTRVAVERYMNGIRADAPWCPWNIEFIRRTNGLDSVDDVHRVVYDAEYLVMGLGDVYLGAPVATPLDPRHRLVTTKYNPARTWTPENAVGIGGAYLCIYGMDSPGGYQLVGRTTQIWNRRYPLSTPGFAENAPWLLRFFDRISWYPVSAEELEDMRADLAAGRGSVDISDGEFSLVAYRRFLSENAADIAATSARMERARDEERARWAASGEYRAETENRAAADIRAVAS